MITIVAKLREVFVNESIVEKNAFFFLNLFPSPRNLLPMTMTKTGKIDLLRNLLMQIFEKGLKNES